MSHVCDNDSAHLLHIILVHFQYCPIMFKSDLNFPLWERPHLCLELCSYTNKMNIYLLKLDMIIRIIIGVMNYDFTNPKRSHLYGQARLSQCYTRPSLQQAAPPSSPAAGSERDCHHRT